MNRIDKKFEELKKLGRKALITFITVGDGGYDLTEEAVLAMERSGADLIELGIPFSDPVAEGPTIQKSSKRALDLGTSLIGAFELVKKLRVKTDMPLLMMMYLNSIFRFGKERFFSLCAEYGIDGVIVPDMPFEEKDEIQAVATSFDVKVISLVAPTSHQRITQIAEDAEGFLYCVSSTGVTGMRSSFDTQFDAFFDEIKKNVKVPFCVGFGIANGDTAKKMASYCDGVIVGSAIVRCVEEHGEKAVQAITDLTRELRLGLDS